MPNFVEQVPKTDNFILSIGQLIFRLQGIFVQSVKKLTKELKRMTLEISLIR